MDRTEELDRLYRDIRTVVNKFTLLPDYTSYDLADDLVRLAVDFANRQGRN